jgi:hypothetical protein
MIIVMASIREMIIVMASIRVYFIATCLQQKNLRERYH